MILSIAGRLFFFTFRFVDRWRIVVSSLIFEAMSHCALGSVEYIGTRANVVLSNRRETSFI